jgi:hypothetical protein
MQKIAETHYKWVVEMNWTKSSVLSKLTLVGSEIGEAADECRGSTLSDNFKYEISDIVLRILALTEEHAIPVGDLNLTPEYVNDLHTSTFKNLNNLDALSIFIVKLGHAISEYIRYGLSNNFWKFLFSIIEYSYFISYKNNIDLNDVMQNKIAKNIIRGSKGRLV